MSDVILRAENLRMYFPVASQRLFTRQKRSIKAVEGITLEVRQGETLGLVGESGCGKSTLGRCLIRLYEPTSGKIEITGTDVTHFSSRQMLSKRRDVQMIFQDPYASLNPRMTVFDIIAEPLRTHRLATGSIELKRQVHDLMLQVGLSPRYLGKYPHEFSGGQRQRVAIARALAVKPKLMICDEPVSALDVSIQAQILNLLKDLQKENNLAMVFIAHDLSAVRHISDRIAVMYLGRIVELANTEDLFLTPMHPYTQALLSAIPIPDPELERQRKRILLNGDLPSPMNMPTGCGFSTRCPIATQTCRDVAPHNKNIAAHHQVSCHAVI